MESYRRRFGWMALALALGICLPARSASFSFGGQFVSDSDVRLFAFTLSAPGTITLKTWSYGGGMDAAGQTISNGGFATDLALYSGSGTLIDFTDSGSCPPQNPDPGTGLCGDSLLQAVNSPAGQYIVAVTEFFNIPNGLTLSAGFLEDGQGNFTGPLLCGTPGGFMDIGCNTRNPNFTLDIVGAEAASAIPEPASLLMTGSGLILLAAGMMRRLGSAKSRA
ncbi:MAG TPA: DVUA0089 family protein [Bryobacteraceae bacterium]|nr:DVUA0089 family protein [Bryobacteraceae bacterium]